VAPGQGAFAVHRRTGEIGIRMALGDRLRILRLILRQGIVLLGIGITLGAGPDNQPFDGSRGKAHTRQSAGRRRSSVGFYLFQFPGGCMRRGLPFVMVLCLSGAVEAQDPMRVAPANYKLVLENASVRILRVSVAPGGKSAMHAHPDHMVVSLSAGKVRFTLPDGKTQDSDMGAETAMYVPASSHSPANVGNVAVDAIVIEFKSAGPGTATLPANREGMAIKVLAEGPRALAYRSTAAPDFQEPAGSKHDYDQVVIALGNAQMSLTMDGQKPKTTWSRGETVFIPRGTGHASRNISGKPVDFVIVAVK
jgi:oxalate decarboxylase/phosphoglucose isomerase-like protein (cupin superfamily)